MMGAAIDEAFRWANPSAGLCRLIRSDVDICGTRDFVQHGTESLPVLLA